MGKRGVNEADFAQFPDYNPGPVCRLDTGGVVRLANAAAKHLFGEKRITGGRWTEVCPGMTETLWGRIAAAVKPVSHEADFGDHCVLFTHVRLPSEDIVFAYGADVTQLRMAERKISDQAVLLAEQAASLADLARFPEMNPGPVLRLDLEGNVLLANAGAKKIFGTETGRGKWTDMCPGLDRGRWDEVLAADGPVAHEANVGNCAYVFTHRRDQEGDFVFVFGADVTKRKLAEKALRQAEKMATLGTLAAGVAHELNNPAAAAHRSAEQLQEILPRLEKALLGLNTAALTDQARQVMHRLDTRARDRATKPADLDPVSRSDLESEIDAWLSDRGIPESWELAPPLAGLGLGASDFAEIERVFHDGTLQGIISWAASAYPVHKLLYEISQGAARISEIVGALKGYSYVGQARVRMINVHDGLDNTLVILRSKLKGWITVTRAYDPEIPPICAYAGELNQVWTNLLDNAADAMGGKGHIVIRTSRHGNHVVVEIEDDGPGIPQHIQSRIFDPFFTTKEPGKGTGLGLSTTYAIVKDLHKGEIAVESRPGRTIFTVRLLIDNPDLMRDRRPQDGTDHQANHT